MDFLPLFFQLRDKPCLIIGGGHVALRKASLLCQAGARVYVVAHDICPPLKERAIGSGGDIRCGDYQRSDLQGKHLVIAATDNTPLNTRVSRDAHAQHIPVNVVDNPQLCSFIFPSVIDRSPLLVAVSSGGKSPVLTRLLRSKIESFIPFAYGKLATLVGHFRKRVKLRFDNPDDRRHFWERILQGPVAEMVLAGKTEAAEQLLTQTLSDPIETPPTGEVYLVGAGPGDPDLLTFKALRLMQKADIVLYDRLVSEPVLELTRRDAHKIYVGKARASHTLAQHDINQLLVDFALQGKRVVRLKGGDPFIFGRGGEEIQALARHNIPFQVVPGITAASGCAAYSGIALTHRDYAQSVRFVTGHLKEGQMNLPWQELVHDNQTVVFYMGLMGLPVICQQLINHGQAAHTPAALIQQGTTPQQKVLVGTLATLPDIVASQCVKAPTLIIVGNVVKLHAQLNWFESKVT